MRYESFTRAGPGKWRLVVWLEDRMGDFRSMAEAEIQGREQLHQCVILLATHNGDQWLSEQLESIYGQAGVSVAVLANDDQSVDGTQAILECWAVSHGLKQMPGSGQHYGSANKNFLRMIRDADIGVADYVALADQDDVWSAGKLERAISRLEASGADAYSSNVEAFWPNGRTRLVRKSQPQKAWDYLFSSPGPGCTFVFRRAAFLDLRHWVRQNFEALSKLWVHDWTLYAYVRNSGRTWLIDDYVSLRYRQHGGNDIGANIGLLALTRRLERMRSGAYRNDVLSLARLLNVPLRLIQALERMNFWDRLWLWCRAPQFRRSSKEVAAMMVAFFLLK